MMKHSERDHALLSASGAVRWLNCPPSARLEEEHELMFPPITSVFAEEGTLAHEYSETILRHELDLLTEEEFKKKISELRDNPLYKENEMDDEVEKYTTFVLELFAEIRVKHPDAVILIEERLDFSHIVEKGFGTGDVLIIADGVIYVIDLKYGRGVQVEAEENPQLKLYGSGAIRKYELMYDIHTVELIVMQPRLNHISRWRITVKDLELWQNRTVKPIAKLAYEGKGVQKAGDHCRWCKVKANCATLAAKNVALARMDFKDPHLLTDEQVLEVYEQIPLLKQWADAVAQYMLDSALEGKQWKGYKVVRGTSQRRWVDQEKVIEMLKRRRFRKMDYIQEKLIGIPAVEKLMGREKMYEDIGDLINKPDGRPILTTIDDKRPAIGHEDAAEDFGK